MISVVRCFFDPTDPNAERVVRSDDERRRLPCLGGKTALVVGPRSAGPASLAWGYCASVAAEGDAAWIVCARGSAPVRSAGCEPGWPGWRSVALTYVDSVEDAVKVGTCAI